MGIKEAMKWKKLTKAERGYPKYKAPKKSAASSDEDDDEQGKYS